MIINYINLIYKEKQKMFKVKVDELAEREKYTFLFIN